MIDKSRKKIEVGFTDSVSFVLFCFVFGKFGNSNDSVSFVLFFYCLGSP